MSSRIRLSYILLGLGIGILLTNFIYYIRPNVEYRNLSDDEIIEKAKDLGMVFVKDTIQIDKYNEENIDETIKEKEEDYIDEFKEEEEKDYVAEPKEEILFKIEEGQNLKTIATNLYNIGLIDDTNSFISFCKEKNITTLFRVGTYKLTKGMDYETLIKILTKRSTN